jgi:hypothetical protein
MIRLSKQNKSKSKKSKRNRSRRTPKSKSKKSRRNRSKRTPKSKSKKSKRNRSRRTPKSKSKKSKRNRSRRTPKSKSKKSKRNRSKRTPKSKSSKKCFFTMTEKGYTTYIPYIVIGNKMYTSEYFIESMKNLILQYFQKNKYTKLKNFKKLKKNYKINDELIKRKIINENIFYDGSFLIDIIMFYIDTLNDKEVYYDNMCKNFDKEWNNYWNELIIE